MVNYKKLSEEFGIEISSIKAFVEVESSGEGFDSETKKIKIQFEPGWFKKFTKLLINNGVESQEKEWKAFNLAFSKNPDKAMQSTSWGCMQVLGLHFKACGFSSVGSFVDFMKESEQNQVWAGLAFIRSNKTLFRALSIRDWTTVAKLYNGPLYYIKGYHKKLATAEIKHRIMN